MQTAWIAAIVEPSLANFVPLTTEQLLSTAASTRVTAPPDTGSSAGDGPPAPGPPDDQMPKPTSSVPPSGENSRSSSWTYVPPGGEIVCEIWCGFEPSTPIK